MPLEVTLEKAREAQQKGELKHAIEILRSSLGNYGFSQELFKEYGELLRKCGYTSQAGKYFFLSVPEPNEVEEKCIKAYQKTVDSKNDEVIYKSLPKPGRLENLSDYPEFVQNRLRKLGLSKENLRFERNHFLAMAIFISLTSILGILILIGLGTVISWLF